MKTCLFGSLEVHTRKDKKTVKHNKGNNVKGVKRGKHSKISLLRSINCIDITHIHNHHRLYIHSQKNTYKTHLFKTKIA